MPAILGGHIPVGSPTYPSVKSLLDAKQLKLIVLLIDKHADVHAQMCLPLLSLVTSSPPGMANALFAPKGTPDDLVKKLTEAAAKVSQEPEFRSKLMDLGIRALIRRHKVL